VASRPRAASPPLSTAARARADARSRTRRIISRQPDPLKHKVGVEPWLMLDMIHRAVLSQAAAMSRTSLEPSPTTKGHRCNHQLGAPRAQRVGATNSACGWQYERGTKMAPTGLFEFLCWAHWLAALSRGAHYVRGPIAPRAHTHRGHRTPAAPASNNSGGSLGMAASLDSPHEGQRRCCLTLLPSLLTSVGPPFTRKFTEVMVPCHPIFALLSLAILTSSGPGQ
jgi:hypothetical protein